MFEERSLVNTPVDSPSAHAPKLLQNRLANLQVCPEDERDPSWLHRKFPLSDVENARLNVFSAPSSPMMEPKRIPKPVSLSRSPSYTIITNNTPRNSPLHSPSPLANPPTPDSNWTVKVMNDDEEDNLKEDESPTLAATEKHRKGIVLKLAKK